MGSAGSKSDTFTNMTESLFECEESSLEIFSKIPLEIRIKILLFLDVDTVIKCRRVCKYFANLIIGKDFWHQFLRQHLRLEKKEAQHLFKSLESWNWCKLARLAQSSPFNRNFVKNGSAQLLKGCKDKPHGRSGRDALQQIQYWDILENGGDGWQVQRPPFGSKPVPTDATDVIGSVKNGDFGCFVSSYSICRKSQTIDLHHELKGCVDLMDKVVPDVLVSEWCAGRFDCDSEYKLHVQLLDCNHKVLGEIMERKLLGGGNTYDKWINVSGTFQAYPPGVRFIRFIHQGNDLAFWAGWYGAKMTGASVRLLTPSPKLNEDQ